MSTSRPTQTRKSLMRPRVERPCSKCKNEPRIPGLSWGKKCKSEKDIARARERQEASK